MKFTVSFGNPFQKEVVDLGVMERHKIVEKFNSIDWNDYLKRMELADESEIYYSPSFEVVNTADTHGLAFYATGKNEWYVFYKRPKRVKVFFGLFERLNENYLTETEEQTKQDVINYLNALLDNNLEFLEEKLK